MIDKAMLDLVRNAVWLLDAVHTIIAVGWVYVYEELLTFWKYYCVGESESEKDSSEEEKKKKKHKKSKWKEIKKKSP